MRKYKKVDKGTRGAKLGFSGDWYIIEDTEKVSEDKPKKQAKKVTKKA